MSEETLAYVNAIGDEEDQKENLTFHASLMLGQVRALSEIDIYHRNYPWRVVLALDASRWGELLSDMKLSWMFVRDVCDPLCPRDPLGIAMSFTRHQSFRDVMVKAE